jgi:hypothetical protein
VTIIFLIRVSFLNSLGNKIVNDQIFLKKIEGYIRNTKSESVFFTLYDEEKTAMFVWIYHLLTTGMML